MNHDLLLPVVAGAVSAHGLDVEVLACDPALADTAAFCAAYGFALEDSANTIVVVGKAERPRFAQHVARRDVGETVGLGQASALGALTGALLAQDDEPDSGRHGTT